MKVYTMAKNIFHTVVKIIAFHSSSLRLLRRVKEFWHVASVQGTVGSHA